MCIWLMSILLPGPDFQCQFEIADVCLYRGSEVVLVLGVRNVEDVGGKYRQRYVCLNH